MPDRLRIAGPGECRQGCSSSPASRRKSRVPSAPFRFKVGRIAEPGDQVRIGVLIGPPGPTGSKEPADVRPADTLPITGSVLFRLRNVPAHVFRGLVQAPDHPHTDLGRREQILTPLPSRVQPRHSLIQVGPNPAHQPGRRHELDQRTAERRPSASLRATSRSQRNLGRECPARQTCPGRGPAVSPSSNSSSVSKNRLPAASALIGATVVAVPR